ALEANREPGRHRHARRWTPPRGRLRRRGRLRARTHADAGRRPRPGRWRYRPGLRAPVPGRSAAGWRRRGRRLFRLPGLRPAY
ncbi:MAG: hypothetical protein AVDCRST_MAG65-2073, partial [uncultured Solirubrobacteraceae bacterium]